MQDLNRCVVAYGALLYVSKEAHIVRMPAAEHMRSYPSRAQQDCCRDLLGKPLHNQLGDGLHGQI